MDESKLWEDGAVQVTWAQKARASVAAVRGDNADDKPGDDAVPLLDVKVEDENGKLQRCGAPALLRCLPGDVWDVITSFLNFREVQLVSSTCCHLWLLLHRRCNIWRCQLEYFRRDMADLRGDGQLLCTDLVVPPSLGAYERMKLERRLYAVDARREWHFREREKNGRSEGAFSFPLTLAEDDESDDGWGDEEVTPLLQIRTWRPVLRGDANSAIPPDHNGLVGVNGVTGRTSSGSAAAAFHSPSEYLTLCDNINHNDFTGSRIIVQEFTPEEDELLLFALLQTLRRAKRRPPPRATTNESRTSYHLALRYFGGVLLSICRYEAEQLLRSILRMPDLLDDFIVYSDPGRGGLPNPGGSTLRCQTLYFIAPELCRRGRLGLVVVDPVRVLVVVGKERVARDDPRWDDERAVAAADGGHVVYGSGMNPQQARRG
ncbi:hypothetical protein DQ04_08341030 [Trypanosoma grayi]|uniref:hypothetical protein n=1 Tax=Trypanosoma grayi TaxID=71804 RepID=UPI0004F43236|nr:hypothetical protein DQ04_08341030 [Trypanosoma grayi]KEG07972.1 hypothetical protein DQ04_08341030 [Trypanosoma grayi]